MATPHLKPRPHWLVVVERGDRDRKVLPLKDPATLRIGRDPGSDVVIEEGLVSRRHAQLELHGGVATLRDQSANGTTVGADCVRGGARAVAPDEPIRVGSAVIRVMPAAGGEAPTSDREFPVSLRRKIHRLLLEHLDLAELKREEIDEARMRPQVTEALRMVLDALREELPPGADEERFIAEMTDEVLGLGPLEELLADPEVSEIMVVDPATIYCERRGIIELTGSKFTDADSARAVLERILSPLGRRIDESNPYVDARLRDGSRVNAIIPPLALRGPCLTIRKFATEPLAMEDLIGFGSLTEQMARFLRRAVVARKSILISGGTGSGKTTLLNVLSASIGADERVVTIEDAAELQLRQPHVVALESRPPNLEGRGAIEIRDLVRNALRMRPDRIVVGECRGGEALDMLQAMNTGHDGSMTTTHANSPEEAVSRLETLALMAGLELPARAIREQIASSVDLVIQQSRLGDGSRRVTHITEVVGIGDEGEIEVRDIFRFARRSTDPSGRIEGEFLATGYLPTFLSDFLKLGLVTDGEYL